ncbi:hypothetical protein K1719_029411 [Acacia pycnantha]|nr:hypothetical protein K1719_029411 [Acacia pycnantha]
MKGTHYLNNETAACRVKVKEKKATKRVDTGDRLHAATLQNKSRDSAPSSQQQYVVKRTDSSLDQNSNFVLRIEDPRMPRISGPKADSVIKKLGYSNSHKVKASGFSRGIWILWSSNVKINILVNHVQFVHMEVLCASHNINFLFTAMYGSPQKQLRRYLWQDLDSLANSISSPWMLAGDINAILHQNERQGLSDHQPISICLGPNHQVLSPSRFKFLMAWISHPDFQGIVRNIWDFGDELLSCIDSFKVEIQRWNSSIFGGIGKRKRWIFRRINGIQSKLELHPDAPSDFLIDLEMSLREYLEDVCFQEELLWIQKSSSDWVCLGDRNTGYYHLKALMHRKRNQVSRLKLSDGTSLEDDDLLSDYAREFFLDLYSLEDVAFIPFPLHGAFPPLMQQHMLSLDKSVTIDEVKQAFFEMKPLKSPGIDGIHALFYQSQWHLVGPSIFDFV